MINKCPPSSVSSTFRVDYLSPTIFLALAVFGTTAIWPPYLMYVVSNVVQGAVENPRCRLLMPSSRVFRPYWSLQRASTGTSCIIDHLFRSIFNGAYWNGKLEEICKLKADMRMRERMVKRLHKSLYWLKARRRPVAYGMTPLRVP